MMTVLSSLNSAQYEAVTDVSGPLLVFAGAGSGKTRAIVYRFANLLAMRGGQQNRIYAVTFTNKAAREMKSRVAQLVGPELYSDISRDLWIGTFHATCARMLRRYHSCVGLEKDFIIYDKTDQRVVAARAAEKLGGIDNSFSDKEVLSFIHKHKQKGTQPHAIAATNAVDHALIDAYTEYQRLMVTCNAVDFDDLIIHVVNIAEDDSTEAGKRLQSQFDHILVDEFQDVNPVQYRLIRALSKNSRTVCVVGDDDQSIYRWRGADVSIIRGFRRDFPSARIVKLEQNYRSTGNIVNAALALITPSPEREPKQLFTTNPVGDPIDVVGTISETDEARFIAQSVLEARKSGFTLNKIAVFYRIHAQSRVIEEALINFGIPYQIVGGLKFFDRKEIKDMLAYMRVVVNPNSDVDLMRIINVPARQIGATTTKHLVREATDKSQSIYKVITSDLHKPWLSKAARKRVDAFANLLDSLREILPTLSLHDFVRHLIDSTGIVDSLLKDSTPESDARVENINEMLGSVSQYEADAEESGEKPSLSGFLERVALVTDTDNMTDGQRLSLMSVHAAKGLEYDMVFVAGFEEGLLPYQSYFGPTDIEEERRLAYVAMTRARKRLVFSHAGGRSLFGQFFSNRPSSFLASIPVDLTRVLFTSRGVALSLFDKNDTVQKREPGEQYVEYDDDVSQYDGY